MDCNYTPKDYEIELARTVLKRVKRQATIIILGLTLCVHKRQKRIYVINTFYGNYHERDQVVFRIHKIMKRLRYTLIDCMYAN